MSKGYTKSILPHGLLCIRHIVTVFFNKEALAPVLI